MRALTSRHFSRVTTRLLSSLQFGDRDMRFENVSAAIRPCNHSVHFIARLFSILRFNNFMVCVYVCVCSFATRAVIRSRSHLIDPFTLVHDKCTRVWLSMESKYVINQFYADQKPPLLETSAETLARPDFTL